MRVPFLAALLGTTALLSPAAAQQTWQPGQQVQGELSACPALFQVVQQRGPQQTGVTFDQIQVWSQQRNEAACQLQLQRLGLAQTQAGRQAPAQATVQPGRVDSVQQVQADGGGLLVQAQPPQIVYDQPAPRVQVVQPQPQVTVRQPQPQIQVRMPAPTITVQQPQPEILVRMAQPDVNVAQAQPQVSVQMPPPEVRYAAPTQQPQVRVEPAQPQVVVQPTQPVQPIIQQAGAPSVQYQQIGEPRVIYQQAQGQPVIRYEQIGPDQRGDVRPGVQQAAVAGNECAELLALLERAQPGTNDVTVEQARRWQQQNNTGACRVEVIRQQQAGVARAPAVAAGTAATGVGAGTTGIGTTTAAIGNRQSISANELLSYNLYDAAGQSLGDVERVLLGANNQAYLVVGYGGFLGLGEKQLLVPIDQVRMVGDRLVAQAMTQAQAEQMTEWQGNLANYRQITGEQVVNMPRS